MFTKSSMPYGLIAHISLHIHAGETNLPVLREPAFLLSTAVETAFGWPDGKLILSLSFIKHKAYLLFNKGYAFKWAY